MAILRLMKKSIALLLLFACLAQGSSARSQADTQILPDSPTYAVGAGDFTVSLWMYQTDPGTTAAVLFGQCNAAGDAASRSVDANIDATTHKVVGYLFTGGAYHQLTSTGTVSLNTWHFLAFVRAGGTYTIYIDGNASGMLNVAGLSFNDSSANMGVGRLGDYPNYIFSGSIEDWQFVKGTALWTANFVPPARETPTPTAAVTETPSLTPSVTLTPSATFAATATPAGANDIIPPQYQGRLHLFVLAGQSNMVGVNAPPGNQETSPAIFDFDNNYRWRVGSEPIDNSVVAVDPVAADTFSGYGPGMAFALHLQTLHPDWAIGLIPCSRGGSSIAEWQRNLSQETLYGVCLKRIRAASTMGTLDGLLFYQGETDAESSASAGGRVVHQDDYAALLEQFINDFRADAGNARLPVAFVQIGNLPADPFLYAEIIRAQQASIHLPGVVMVSAVGLAQNPDGVHLSIGGEQTLGVALANAVEPLLP